MSNGQRGPLWWPVRVRCGRSTNQVVGERAHVRNSSHRRYHVTAELTPPTVVAAWLRAAVEAPDSAARMVSWV